MVWIPWWGAGGLRYKHCNVIYEVGGNDWMSLQGLVRYCGTCRYGMGGWVE